MRRKYQLLLTLLTVFLVSVLVLNSCRPRDDLGDSAVAPFEPDSISVLASPVATIELRPFLARFRIVYVDPG